MFGFGLRLVLFPAAVDDKVGYQPLHGLTFLRARMCLDSADVAKTLLSYRADVLLSRCWEGVEFMDLHVRVNLRLQTYIPGMD